MIVAAIMILGIVLAVIGGIQMGDKAVETSEEHAMAQVDHGDHNEAVQHGEEAHGEEAAHAEGHEAHGAHAEGHEASGSMRIWANLLMNGYYFLLFGIGAMFFWAVNYVANAGWSTLVKRVVEAITSYIWIGALIVLVILILGGDTIYHWVQYQKLGLEPGDAGYDKIMDEKAWFLNKNWLYGGVVIITGLWVLFRTILRRFSLKEDEEGGTKYFHKSVRYSAGFIPVFAFSFSILSWLIIMSIDAHWFSTIFSVYNFAIAFVTSLTVITLFTLYLKSKGYLEVVSDEVVHDLGKFMFAFSIFWAYIWLSQFLLIWYANLPEETVYFNIRLNTLLYEPMFLTNIIMCFVLPFLILMMRNAKRSPRVLILAGSIILLGHWLDLYLMVMPGTMGIEAKIGMFEIGTTMAFAGLFIYIVLSSLSKHSLYAKNHPYLLESANHDVGV